ncbi:MAG TPA: hypothetical protein VLH18_04670 [Candidatus Limnocylindrales bacterium]|nr:hypothetical protein [Candidatus Limnocylindrales bacterium]
MKHSLAIAAWEIKKIVNRSFLLSLLLTPVLMLLFSVGPNLLFRLVPEQMIKLYVVSTRPGLNLQGGGGFDNNGYNLSAVCATRSQLV